MSGPSQKDLRINPLLRRLPRSGYGETRKTVPEPAKEEWVKISEEDGKMYDIPPGTKVRYGVPGAWVEKIVGPEGKISPTNETFSDPAPGVRKGMWVKVGGRRKTRRRKNRKSTRHKKRV